jgi:hypothetical protein
VDSVFSYTEIVALICCGDIKHDTRVVCEGTIHFLTRRISSQGVQLHSLIKAITFILEITGLDKTRPVKAEVLWPHEISCYKLYHYSVVNQTSGLDF